MAILMLYNNNPLRKRTGDCVYRALSNFLDMSWRALLDELVCWAADRGLTNFNYRSTYTAFLKEKGYERHRVPKKGITVGEFCDRYAEKGKRYILSCPRHLTVVDYFEWKGISAVMDTWDCLGKPVDGYWEREIKE